MSASTLRRNFFDDYTANNEPEDDNEQQQPDTTHRQQQQQQPRRRQRQSDPSALVRYISSSVLGSAEVLSSPFPVRPRLLYCDWIASGRSLQFIEQYLQREVLPLYASTHSTVSATGLQSSLFRQEARQIIGRACGASDDDVVLFTGSGSTAAIALLLDILSAGWSEAGVAASQVAFFVGPYAHHSVLLPLRERGFQLLQLHEQTETAGVDLDELRRELMRERAGAVRVKVGFFTAASNVSGIVVDAAAVAAVCSDCGALNVWDFATAAPYIDVDLNPQRSARLAKSAVVLSPHKMVGGVSTPGLLLVKKALLCNSVPSRPGGGSVFFVSPSSHRYLQNFEEREEAGTPDIVAAIRAGLVFQLRQSIAADWREQRLHAYDAMVRRRLQAEPSLQLMGHPHASRRLPIFSFLVLPPSPSAAYLHPNFVSALLNDLFGIQSRSGCLCAGPYAHDCLGISSAVSAALEQALLLRAEVLRPGFTRVSCHYCMDEQDVSFLCDALLFVARSGWKLLPLYAFHTDSGEWRHRQRMTRRPDRRWLGSVSYDSGEMSYDRRQQTETAAPDPPAALLVAAAAEVTRVEALVRSQAAAALADDGPELLDARLQQLRWFMLPSEARACMAGQPAQEAAADGQQQRRQQAVIRPPRYECRGSELPREQAEHGSGGEEASGRDAAQSELPAAEKAESLKEMTEQEEVKEEREDDARAAGGAPTAAQSLLSSLLQAEAESRARRSVRRRQATETAEASRGAAEPAGRVCRHCFHHHWQPAQQRQCVSCACVSFEPVATAALASSAPLSASASVCSSSAVSCSGELRTLSRKLRSLVGRAVLEHAMIAEGDRVLVGVSGGKDSLTLLHVLLALQARAPVRFSLAAVTVDPQTPEYDPQPLKAYMRQLQLPFHYESQPVIAAARACSTAKLSICAFCARMKRGMLYSACRREGYNVLALGQHADDLCESLLMSAMHNGLLRSMKANYRIAAGDVRVIRPLLYVRERQTRLFARLAALPVIVDNCPACFEAPKERQRIKLLLAQQEAAHPNVVSSIMTAMKPLLSIRQAAAGATRAGREGQPEHDDDDE